MFLVNLASWWDAICYIVCYFHWTFLITFSEICLKATLYTYTELELGVMVCFVSIYIETLNT